ncbi:hypothetical protein HPB48_003905 [Haemaphysalis longicornis]|uniref:Uncharacterized protein n=1 Tax=Haemaphysalis longicornis TaxID=44386 RepID=A0A9J6FEP1_HAELO|nr:hypothetical protein HPB48_003905 [Haemaphysalis longicornis]
MESNEVVLRRVSVRRGPARCVRVRRARAPGGLLPGVPVQRGRAAVAALAAASRVAHALLQPLADFRRRVLGSSAGHRAGAEQLPACLRHLPRGPGALHRAGARGVPAVGTLGVCVPPLGAGHQPLRGHSAAPALRGHGDASFLRAGHCRPVGPARAHLPGLLLVGARPGAPVPRLHPGGVRARPRLQPDTAGALLDAR